MPTGFWVEGYWGVRSPEPIETIQIKRSAESIKNIQIERSAKPIKTPVASTQAPPLALVPCTCPHRAFCTLNILHSSYIFRAGTAKRAAGIDIRVEP